MWFLASPSSALIGELRDSLKQKLPTYMLPSAIVALDAFPLTPNGKIDHKALSSPAGASLDHDESQDLARTSTEEALVGIWRELLKLESHWHSRQLFRSRRTLSNDRPVRLAESIRHLRSLSLFLKFSNIQQLLKWQR